MGGSTAYYTMRGEECPRISWLERLKIACCEPSEGRYVTDESDDHEITFETHPETTSPGPRHRPALVRATGRGARGGPPLIDSDKDERAAFPATLKLPKPLALLQTVSLEQDYAEGVDLNPSSARTDLTMESPYQGLQEAAWDPMAEEKTPLADPIHRPASSAAIAPRGSYKRPSGHPGNPTRWTDAVVEGFLYSTLVDGSGLVLMKLSPDGKRKEMGERIVFYDPQEMKLNWISTGIRRKPGGVLAKDITEVNREGTIVTLVYFTDAPAGPPRRRRFSPLRLSLKTTQGTDRRVFQTAKERDAKILREVLLLVQRRAVEISFSGI